MKKGNYYSKVLLVVICLVGALAILLAQSGGAAGAAYPSGQQSGVKHSRLSRLSGVVAVPPSQVIAEARTAALRGDLGQSLKRLLDPPTFGPNVDASLNNAAVQNETTISINPENDQQVIASANDYRANLQPWVYVSSNGGSTWANYQVPGTSGFYYGDPAMAFGTGNRAYFSYLGYNQVCGGGGGMYVSRSTDSGATFSTPMQLAPNTHAHTAYEYTFAANRYTYTATSYRYAYARAAYQHAHYATRTDRYTYASTSYKYPYALTSHKYIHAGAAHQHTY